MLSGTLPEIEGFEIGKHPLTRKLLKAVFSKRPPEPKHDYFWDADLVIDKLKELGHNEDLSLKQLSRKVVLLTALATFMRTSELASIDHSSVKTANGRLVFNILKPRKTQVRGPLAKFACNRFESDPLICPVECILSYINRTVELRPVGERQLFIGLKAPYWPVGSSTIARWIKETLNSSGVDTSVFSAHSTRGSAASKAYQKGVPCDQILAAAGWKRESTFRTYYYKRIADGD